MESAAIRFLTVLLISVFVTSASAETTLNKVIATETELIFEMGETSRSGPVREVPVPIAERIKSPVPLILMTNDGRVSARRFDDSRDRIYSAFTIAGTSTTDAKVKFVEEFRGVSANTEPYPKVASKKGLQVQQVEDAIALGVKHAALNFDLARMINVEPATNDLVWVMDGRSFSFKRNYVEGIDRQVKALSDAGATVSLILLNYVNANARVNEIMLHPKYDRACPNHLSAFNTSTPEGIAHFKASIEFLAARYAKVGYPYGRVVNYIVGNEVNSHWYWSNMGRVSMEEFTDDYLRAVRLCHTAVRKFSENARVFVSLEHHWNLRFPGADEKQGFAARPFLDLFNKKAAAQGNFDWHVAFHPYPENLFNPRTWNDTSATAAQDTARITFKNLEQLIDYLERPELKYEGKPRRVILSEQGFHSDGTQDGEVAQAAGYAYAYQKVRDMEGVDSFILHRHIDHAHEGGLNLGLWRRNTNSTSSAEPLSKKPIYDVFKAADTPQWTNAFEFALPVIGIKSWNELQNGHAAK